MNKKDDIRVFFGIPTYGGQMMTSFHRCVTATERAGLIYQACYVDGDSLVPRARNNLTAEFLATDCTHLLFIDSDIVFEPRHVSMLIDGARSGRPIVSGLYPKKQKELAWVINTMNGEQTDESGFRRVKYAGTGFMLIARYVFERMKIAYPEIAYVTDSGELNDKREIRHDFWKVGVYRNEDVPVTEPGRYLSEDWYFCQMMEDMGMPVVMNMGIHTQHIGQVAYPLEEVPMQDKDGNPIKKEEKAKPAAKSNFVSLPKDGDMERHVRKIFEGEYKFENPTEDGDLIYDIGANCGGFLAWAKLEWPNSPIVAFEPIPDNFEHLKRTAQPLQDVQLVNAALTTTDAKEMWVGFSNCGEASLFEDVLEGETGKVAVETMNPADLPPAAFYKIDAEGSELDIVKALDLSKAKAVVMEWHRASDYIDLKAFFAEQGFELRRDDKRYKNRGILAFAKEPESVADECKPES